MREELLNAVIEHAADHGIADRSLRTIADAIGTSHRMLIYHFGSREGLLAAVVAAVEAGQREVLAELDRSGHDDPHEVGMHFWSLVTGPAMRYGPLFFELATHAMQRRPHAESMRAEMVEPWLEPLTRLMVRGGDDPRRARIHARLALATSRGLLHDALVTGDLDAANEAMAEFTDAMLASVRTDESRATSRPATPSGD
ncbi:TetR/AcrR family transcriptional regulator [Pseudonocardia endophytica]|uniref:TetR family transcriptional regulator n=1 Tax=Pseudonocardia endophytica TaxID=401976 RepID=A0A4V6NDK6_PSEEN|nr:TetR family transcriptional regulator [Pseudonocardia endophytica]TCK27386.1 TetR family transcriptional regulator [Pseudonocardia endophytica]